MLNPQLKLNPKIFDQDVEQVATRKGYGQGLVELGEKNPNIVALCADLTESTQVEDFANKFPQRYFEVGVAEQNMAAIAAGLAVSGKIPFISSYATFSPGKNWETIRTTIAYNQANVKIAGHHSGVVTGPDGATHQATEDIALMRTLPNVQVVVPCDTHEAKKATVASANIDGPVYLRFTRDKTPVITTEDTPFEIGKIQQYWQTEKPQALILGTGHMLYYALLVAKELEVQGINVCVANVATVKPLDQETLLALGQKAQAVVTVEDHQIAGGMGSAVCEFLAQNYPIPMEFIGLRDTFAESGSPKELIGKYGMGKDTIEEHVKKVISRKK